MLSELENINSSNGMKSEKSFVFISELQGPRSTEALLWSGRDLFKYLLFYYIGLYQLLSIQLFVLSKILHKQFNC